MVEYTRFTSDGLQSFPASAAWIPPRQESADREEDAGLRRDLPMSLTPTPKLQLMGIRKYYGSLPAVKDLSLDVRPAEFLTLLGPSGCGKTTVLMLIAGFIQPDRGRILLDGVDITGRPPFRRRVNTVFQNYALFPHMNVFDNVAFGLKMAGLGRKEIRRRVGEYLELLGMSGFEKRYPRQLSGGQQQRVALARALVNQPQVLLLDEPLAALDVHLRRQVQDELKRLQKALGTTFVYVTHDREEALTMSDRIAILREGRLEQVGTAQEVYRRPRSRFVAQFIGETNLLPATVLGRQGSTLTLEVLGWRLSLPQDAAAERAETAEAPGSEGLRYVSLRPECIRPAADGQPGVIGRVSHTVFAGPAVKVWARVPGFDTPLLVVAPAGSPLAEASPGQEVRLTWDPSDLVLVA